jgi:hypothetical protein
MYRTFELAILRSMRRAHEYDLERAVTAPLLTLWQIHAKIIVFRKLGDSRLHCYDRRAPEFISGQNCDENT